MPELGTNAYVAIICVLLGIINGGTLLVFDMLRKRVDQVSTSLHGMRNDLAINFLQVERRMGDIGATVARVDERTKHARGNELT